VTSPPWPPSPLGGEGGDSMADGIPPSRDPSPVECGGGGGPDRVPPASESDAGPPYAAPPTAEGDASLVERGGGGGPDRVPPASENGDPHPSPLPGGEGARRGAEPGSNRGGGPKTDEGRQTALENLRPDGAMTHGIYAYLSRGTMPRCDRCDVADDCPYADNEELNPTGRCVIMQLVYDEQKQVLQNTEHLQGQPAYSIVMDLLARLVATMAKINLQLGHTGLFRETEKGPEAQSLLELQLKVGSKIVELCKMLGLTPQSVFQLRLHLGDGLSAIEAAMRDAERDVIEGEFERDE